MLTIMYYLWHLFSILIAFNALFFLNYVFVYNLCIYCAVGIFFMLVGTWLRRNMPLFIGVTSCIWGVAILVYHQIYV